MEAGLHLVESLLLDGWRSPDQIMDIDCVKRDAMNDWTVGNPRIKRLLHNIDNNVSNGGPVKSRVSWG